MTKIERMKDIAKQLENATGPDRALNVKIALATIYLDYTVLEPVCGVIAEPLEDGRRGYPAHRHVVSVDQFTRSIDAALGLVERILPGWGVCILVPPDGNPHQAEVYPGIGLPDHATLPRFNFAAPTAPLAILRALFVALITKEGASDGH